MTPEMIARITQPNVNAPSAAKQSVSLTQERVSTAQKTAVVVGDGYAAEQIASVLRFTDYAVEPATCLCGALDLYGEPDVELVIFTTHQPWRGGRVDRGMSAIFNMLRKHHGLVVVSTNGHPDIEPSFLDAGVDMVIPFEQVSSPVFRARLAVIARRVRASKHEH